MDKCLLFSIPKYGLTVIFFQPKTVISNGFGFSFQFFFNKHFCEGFQKYACNFLFFNRIISLHQVSLNTITTFGRNCDRNILYNVLKFFISIIFRKYSLSLWWNYFFSRLNTWFLIRNQNQIIGAFVTLSTGFQQFSVWFYLI